jgi:hypothetical protein
MTKLQLIKQLADEDQPILQNVQKGHAYNHFEESKHIYAMEIETKKVWDFCKENYVNRLIQNEIDGKLVEIGDYQGDDDRDASSQPILQMNNSMDPK